MRIRHSALAAMGIVMLLSGCANDVRPAATDAAGTPASPGITDATESAGIVDIGDGRELYLDCRGTGSPTVILISGTGGAADEWMVVADDAATPGPPTASLESVFDTLALSTRVCAYDRPGTTLASGAQAPSTLVAQPTTALAGADDLEALLARSGETGPYVVVGASWGGMIAQLFARENADSVRGIVLVDSASSALKDTLSPEQWNAWMSTIAATNTGSGTETPDYETSLAELAEAPPMPAIPSVVLSSDQEWDLGVTPGTSTWPAWLAAQNELAAEIGATHITETGSSHGIHVEQPELVSEAVAGVVDDVRQ